MRRTPLGAKPGDTLAQPKLSDWAMAMAMAMAQMVRGAHFWPGRKVPCWPCRSDLRALKLNAINSLIWWIFWFRYGLKGKTVGKAFDSVRQGLLEATQHARGQQAGVKVFRPAAIDVAGLRARMGLTQAQFATRLGFSVATLRHWELGDRQPRGPALVLLNLIDRDPAAVLRLLG